MNDDELLARLKAADPALTPSAPQPDIDRLVEATLSTDTNTSSSTDSSTDTGLRSAESAEGITTRPVKSTAGLGRRHLLGLAAAAGLLMLGGGVAGGIVAGSDNGHSNSAAPLALTAASDPGAGKCMAPTPDTLRGSSTLFVGTVTAIEGAKVTFHVDHWLTGGGTDTVVLDSNTDQPETLTFLDGDRYIVSANDGVVPACGANGASDETVEEFRQAYGK